MWQTKIWKFKTLDQRPLARQKFDAFITKHGHKIQWHEIFVNNAYGIEYRPLRIIG
jgi:hypothetical protein